MDKKWSQWIPLRCISDKGWVDHELFLLSWRTFSCACCTLLSLLLLLDGHSTHTDLASLKFARDQGIIIFWLSPHTSVNLWCSLFKPLKEHWKQECHSFIAGTQDKLNFNGTFWNAWLNSVTPANVVAGFRKTGEYPFNQDAISCTDVSVSENQDEEG